MTKTIFILFILYSFLDVTSQNDSIKKVDFSTLERKLLNSTVSNKDDSFEFDFRIMDSLHFYENSLKTEFLTTDHKKDFELRTGDRKSIIKFECKEIIPATCYRYAGYSENAEVHLISKCRDICELYLIDPYSGSTITISSDFDSGSFPVFLPGYMILCSTFYDDSFGEYYEYRSIIDIYETKNTYDLMQKFKYIGSINSKNWSIQEVYESKNPNSFLLKIYDKRNEFDYVEINIE